jgi:C_GCAxxG_C_C family probable redox protein
MTPATASTSAATALHYFHNGYNCAQSILAAFAPRLDLDPATAIRLAAGLGGGMSRQGEVCGVVSAAVLLLGWREGSVPPGGQAEHDRLGPLVDEFFRRFRAELPSVRCRELLQIDLRDLAGREAYDAQQLDASVCDVALRTAAALLDDLLADERLADERLADERLADDRIADPQPPQP